MRSINEFRESLKSDQPPKELTELLQALWWDAKGSWDKAHETAQDASNTNGAWVHAYLHRKEGNEGNASYWYSHAGKPKSTASLDQEWEKIVASLLEENKRRKQKY